MTNPSPADNRRGIFDPYPDLRGTSIMTAPDAKSYGTLVGEELHDEEFRKEWERLEMARIVAAAVVAYRHDHGLSQRQLAERLGCSQPQVARLEIAETNPSETTLMRLAGRLGMEFNISITADDQTPRLVAKSTIARSQIVRTATHSSMRFATSSKASR
jgi:transcriptional regulator with XRE-family HTH domain